MQTNHKKILRLIRSGKETNIELAFSLTESLELDINKITQRYFYLLLLNDGSNSTINVDSLIKLFNKNSLEIDFENLFLHDQEEEIIHSNEQLYSLLTDCFSELQYLKNLEKLAIWNDQEDLELTNIDITDFQLPIGLEKLEFWVCQQTYSILLTPQHTLSFDNVLAEEESICYLNKEGNWMNEDANWSVKTNNNIAYSSC